MNMNISNRKPALYDYQKEDLELILEKLSSHPAGKATLLYQLATGGGKTVVFSELAKRFVERTGRQVLVLTHRIELCRQTANALKIRGVANKVIDSSVKKMPRIGYSCYVAMVETLKRRIGEGLVDVGNIGLVIVDEAHHNSFRKLLGKFTSAAIIGVTATPFSADVNLPMNGFYQELIIGQPISSLIERGFLAKPKVHSYEVELNSLKTGLRGDFTVTTSDALYGSDAMLELLLHAYQQHALNKKTLIFNNGIFASKRVCQAFADAGIAVKHLDNKASASEREEILNWFRKTKGAVLSSVSILTTGFDEPSIQSVILYRATNSLTLYHQMVGRGARRIAGKKKTFTLIDLGNNVERFGDWHGELDWKHIFDYPEVYHDSIQQLQQERHPIPAAMRQEFSASLTLAFDVVDAYHTALATGQKAKVVIRDSIRQHALMCVENGSDEAHAQQLIASLDKEIDYRVKLYGKCIGKVTKDYVKWLGEDYRSRLQKMVHKLMAKRRLMAVAS
ncbi:MAG: DEAD/DEAH box helicase [Sphingobacteriales bacterium]|nr:MAG: DEAD/DEAH box helicase [Sphingobacteriales bacterium]